MKTIQLYFSTFIISLLILQPATAQWNGKNIRGNGKVVVENRKVSKFTGVKVGGAFDVFIKQGSEHKLEIETDENLLDVIQTKIEGNTLVIKTTKGIQNTKKLNVYITLNKLDHLAVSGAADVKGESIFKSEKMNIDVSGAADIDLDIRSSALVCNQTGSSKVVVVGTADMIGVSASGSSDFKGEGLKAASGKIKSSGSADVYVYLSESIQATASGSSDIICKGNPHKTQINTSGSADINMD